MSDLRTAAQQALDAMHSFEWGTNGLFAGEFEAEIAALRAALYKETDTQNCFEEREADWALQKRHAEQTIERDRQWREAQSIIQPEIKDDKPFGYFRAEPFGWTDCAPTDEGAIPLYERPQQPPTPPEAQTEAEKVAYCAGWWDALEKKRK